MIQDIKQVDNKTLMIKWTDDSENLYDVVQLRRMCPCAECVNEFSGKRTLDPQSISEQVRPVTIDSVGRYALNIRFSDSHSTGFYTFDYLKSLS